MYYIFHHNDMDGIFSKIIVKDYIPTDNPMCLQVNYEPDVMDKFSLPKEGDTVIIVDYSFTEDTAKILDALMDAVGSDNITWIDHHISSLNLIKAHPVYGKIPGVRSVSHCGAWLAWEYFHNEDPLDVIKYVSDYDCWQQQMKPQCDYLNAAFYGSEDRDSFVSLLLNKETDLTHVFEIGEIIYKADKINKENIGKTEGYESELEGHKCYCVNAHGNSLYFPDDIMSKYEFVVLWHFNGERYIYSLYSKGDFDTSKISEKFGGGGHPGASGFSSNKLLVVKRGE